MKIVLFVVWKFLEKISGPDRIGYKLYGIVNGKRMSLARNGINNVLNTQDQQMNNLWMEWDV